jgi:hypothetical protein
MREIRDISLRLKFSPTLIRYAMQSTSQTLRTTGRKVKERVRVRQCNPRESVGLGAECQKDFSVSPLYEPSWSNPRVQKGIGEMSRIKAKRQAKRIDKFWANRVKTGAKEFGGFQIVTLKSQHTKTSCLKTFHKKLKSKKPIQGGLPELGKRR